MRLPQLIPVVVVAACAGGKPVQIQRPQPDVPRVLLTAETVFVARENLPVKRLPPSAFPELPRRIVRELEAEGCAIPQPDETLAGSGQYNVIRGEFVRKGQRDWAVLCSRDGQSAIRVFWTKHTACLSEFRRDDDSKYVGLDQRDSPYWRSIRAVRASDLGAWAEPPASGVMQHHGIADEFVGKTATVYYCDGNTWITAAVAASEE